MYLLGLDLGSSSVKASLLDVDTGVCAGSAHYPKSEAPIASPQPGFAEQNPADWYAAACAAVRDAVQQARATGADVSAIGIAYQMHGLVCVDANQEVVRPAIIWCDSRAVPYGDAAMETLGSEQCLSHLLNSPGNFTATKLAWVKEHEPENFARTHKILLPGDWLAMMLTGQANTTASGLSEGMLWDFKNEQPAGFLLEHLGFSPDVLAERVPTFGPQGALNARAANDLGLSAGIPVTYRGGDQPNNALSLNVMRPGEIAATAGTSGVVYGVSEDVAYDPQSRVNTFLHVNHTAAAPRLGVLLCVNGSGILKSWTRRLMGGDLSYDTLNGLAEQAPVGSDGLVVLPFGNGAERLLGNRRIGASFNGLDLNRHDRTHVCRAVQESVVFAFRYGLDIMRELGIVPSVIRAGQANMFLSDVFCETLSAVSGARIELYETDGALGAARGAGMGAGIYASADEAFSTLEQVKAYAPAEQGHIAAYEAWKAQLERALA
ncbi:MAG: FGGY family carbohydrate kinase [Kiritimatiellae bacterium]|nr:FGGY family carbohydrate kinase [Kiritimatiellia bacterium]